MTSDPSSSARSNGRRRPRLGLVVPVAGLATIAAIAIPLGIHASSGTDAEPRPAAAAAGEAPPPSEVTTGGAAVRFGRFPLDQGWEETYGSNAVDGPGPDAGGISMPEGHCHDEVLFESGYQDKLSAYVASGAASRTREILGYASPRAARSTFRALGDAVTSCATFDDPYSGRVTHSAEVFESIDEANARTGTTTFTFAYTASGSAPSGVLYQFALDDDVVYGSNHYGEWTAETARDAVTALDGENAALLPLLSRIER